MVGVSVILLSEPQDFATFSSLVEANKPVWGTCPDGTSTTSDNIYFENNTCKCPEANVGDTSVIDGVTYTVVDRLNDKRRDSEW